MRSIILILVTLRLEINLDPCMSPSSLLMRDINWNNDAQSKLFLRLLPFSNFVDRSSALYINTFLSIEICQIVFSPVISKGTVGALESQIEDHLKLFKQLFLDKNITPQQHYGIHIPSHIISLIPPIRVSRFCFEHKDIIINSISKYLCMLWICTQLF